MLLMLAPAIHQQPDWPFPWALNPSALARPGTGSLFVPAHPTSFYRSPTGFTAASIVHGGKLFAGNCAGCHAVADPQALPPEGRSDGDLFWLLRHGADQAGSMPGFGDKLSAGDLWAVIDFLKARDIARRGSIAPPSPAPDVPVMVGGKTVPLSHLRGKIIRLVATDKGEDPAQMAGAVSLRMEPGSDGWAAYATLTGVDQAGLRHFTFLIDTAGLLRGIFPPRPDGFPDDTAFATALTPVETCSAGAPCP
jgi:mono/diheme cytochrome c family protein